MKKAVLIFGLFVLKLVGFSQDLLTPEKLTQLSKVVALGISKDNKSVIYLTKTYSISESKSTTKFFSIPIAGGKSSPIEDPDVLLVNSRISPDGNQKIVSYDVKVKKIFGTDFYPNFPKSDVMIYDNLNYRHWDTWEDGAFGHVFLCKMKNGVTVDSIDLMANEPYDCPQKPSGGDEDFIWSKDGKSVLYVTKKSFGRDYAVSTNTDIYSYDIATGKTTNLTEGMLGYDIKPAFSVNGTLAFLSMKTDGYESDKNDIVVKGPVGMLNLTKHWDGTVDDFKWSIDGKKIYFTAPVDGTIQLFEVAYLPNTKNLPVIKQITNGDFDVRSIVGQVGNTMVVERTDMNHASEIFTVDLNNGSMQQLTTVNNEAYKTIAMSKVERRYMTTTDGKKMLTWVIYPPNFDPSKKYPALLYCQGGPQSALSQFYSFRWNFQLMAANGYIVVAPNRRGMPGHGVEWNEQISGDYGGQNMKDYLTAIDEMCKEPFIDKNRLGCVGASYGGYSVYFLAGNHNKRFKSFISHDGIFDWRSMYGTTEELFFVNKDLGGAYWDTNNKTAMKAYNEFNPVNYVKNWDTPILIIQGEKDYRVPIEQGLQAFQAAQLQGIKSKLLYFPSENHWVLKEQNSLVWQKEFYKWLAETVK